MVATASQEGETDVTSDPVTLTINCPQGPVVITQPDTITDCESDFVVSGTADPGTETVTLSIQGGNELGSTTEIDDTTGAWSITLDPTDPDLGEGTFTVVATASQEGETDVTSDPVTLTINCPQGPVVITQPDTITDCESDFVVSGTADPGTETVTLSIQGGNELGSTTEIDDTTGAWSITLDPTDPDLGEGTFTVVATASQEGETDVTSDPVTLTINCPQGPVVITQPDTITDCESDFVVSGTADPGTETVTLSIQGGNELGSTTEIDDTTGAWSITLDPTESRSR